MRYIKKPVAIEAYQTDNEWEIHSLEGVKKASVGDYIIAGVQGEKYPCKQDIFEQTYVPVDSSKMAYVASLFEKEVSEPFSVRYPTGVTFRAAFTDGGLRISNPSYNANDVLVKLLKGEVSIIQD